MWFQLILVKTLNKNLKQNKNKTKTKNKVRMACKSATLNFKSRLLSGSACFLHFRSHKLSCVIFTFIVSGIGQRGQFCRLGYGRKRQESRWPIDIYCFSGAKVGKTLFYFSVSISDKYLRFYYRKKRMICKTVKLWTRLLIDTPS